jgi:hypothetical protein
MLHAANYISCSTVVRLHANPALEDLEDDTMDNDSFSMTVWRRLFLAQNRALTVILRSASLDRSPCTVALHGMTRYLR